MQWNPIYKVHTPGRGVCCGCKRTTLLPWARTETRVNSVKPELPPPYGFERYCLKCAEPIRAMDGLRKIVVGKDDV